MSEHIKRKIDIFDRVLPEEGTPEFKLMTEHHKKMVMDNPGLKKMFKDNHEKAVKSAIVQGANGIGLGVDMETRHYLREFNTRAWEHGLRSMPMMFNIMEAFFEYNKSIIYFELLPEEDYLISFYDFLDYYLSDNFKNETKLIKENLEDGLIYNFNVGADIGELTFKIEDGEKFVIGGISLVRRNNEVTILFQTGQVTDTQIATEGLSPLDKMKIAKGKEKLVVDNDWKLEAVKLNGNKDYWKTLIACRFDLETETIDGRYVAVDAGQYFDITTDEIIGFLKNGEFFSDEYKESYKVQLIEIEKYNAIFELAKVVLYLPFYFNNFEDDIYSEDHATEYREYTSSPIKAREYRIVDDKFKIPTRPLYVLNRNNKFASDRVSLQNSNFKIESSGYWKNLSPDEFGMDKKGNQITGKTWVNRKETYFEGKTEPLIVTKETKNNFNGPNSGFIYVMRNSYLPENVYKIGLTTGSPQERADQLSKTSIPDRHRLMREWNVADCKEAEKEIHQLLADFRVDERREFFELDMKIINETVEKVIDKINSNFSI